MRGAELLHDDLHWTGERAGAPHRSIRLACFAQQTFGVVFAAWLIWALLAFPYYKNMPVGYVPVAAGIVCAGVAGRRALRRRLGRFLDARRESSFLAVTIGLAVVLRVLCVLALRNEPLSDHAYYHRAALSLLRGAGYPPSAYYPPGMSFWLAGVYALGGPSQFVGQLANALIGGLYAWITYVVARQVVSKAAARLAAVMAAVFPSLIIDATTLDYGPLLGCLLFAAVALFQRRPAGTQPWWYVALIGVVLAAVSFVKPIGLLLPAVFALCYWQRGTPAVRSARNGGILLAAMLAALAPWSLRNYRLFGAYVPVTTSGGTALWVSNNPRATGLSTPLPRFPPEMNEVQRDRALWKRAWTYLREDPARFFELVPVKAAYMWGTSSTILSFVQPGRLQPRAERLLKLMMNTAWVMVCFWFIVAVLRDGLCRATLLFWPLMCLLAYLWGIHQFYEAQCKYYLPFLPAMFIGAAVGWLGSAERHAAPAEAGGRA